MKSKVVIYASSVLIVKQNNQLKDNFVNVMSMQNEMIMWL